MKHSSKRHFRTVLLFLFVIGVIIWRKPLLQKITSIHAIQEGINRLSGIQQTKDSIFTADELRYAYGTLSGSEQLIYNQMADCMLHYKKKVTLSTKDRSQVSEVFQCVMSDYPEFFYVSSYECASYKTAGMESEIEFRPIYDIDRDTAEDYQRQIDAAVADCLAALDEDADTYTTVKYCYEYIITHTEYDMDAEHNQNICSVFLNGKSVCMGYARAFQYLLLQKNILCTVVSGNVMNQAHAWNLIKMDGDYYYADVTWGDPEFSEKQEKNTYIDYSYLGMTTAQIDKKYVIENIFTLPECSAIQDNYFRREGFYIDSFSKDELFSMIRSGWTTHDYVSICCKDLALYKQILRYLIEDGNIASLTKSNAVHYMENEDFYVLTIWKS